MQRLHVEVKGFSPQAADMVKEVNIVGHASKRRGLFKKHLLKGSSAAVCLGCSAAAPGVAH